VRASVSSLSDKHLCSSRQSSMPPQSTPLVAQSDTACSPQADTQQPLHSAEPTLHATAAAVRPVTALADESPMGVVQPNSTGLLPVDDALLQLVLQTLSESSLEQLQQHQQRQQQEQQTQQQEAMERQLALQLLAHSSLHQMHRQVEAEQSQQQGDLQATQAHEAMLQALAEAALAGLSQERQQQEEQQKLLQQQQEVYEQQQQLLQQQSAVRDALEQQQQWHQAQQQQQLFAEQQKLILQQQAMLAALQQQQQQQESLGPNTRGVHMQTQAQAGSDPGTWGQEDTVSEGLRGPVQQYGNGILPLRGTVYSSTQQPVQDPASPPSLSSVPQHTPAAAAVVQAAVEAAEAAGAQVPPPAGATGIHTKPWEIVNATIPELLDTQDAILPPSAEAAPCSGHSASLSLLPPGWHQSAGSDSQHPTQPVPLRAAQVIEAAADSVQTAGMPQSLAPQAYYLIPASAYINGALPMPLPAALPQHASPAQTLPLMPMDLQAAPQVKLSSTVSAPPNVHMLQQQQQQIEVEDEIVQLPRAGQDGALSDGNRSKLHKEAVDGEVAVKPALAGSIDQGRYC